MLLHKNSMFAISTAPENFFQAAGKVNPLNQKQVLSALNIPAYKEFPTYQKLGNMGTVSLPVTAAMADEQGFLKKGDKVSFLGIGSGLNCMMLGFEW